MPTQILLTYHTALEEQLESTEAVGAHLMLILSVLRIIVLEDIVLEDIILFTIPELKTT